MGPGPAGAQGQAREQQEGQPLPEGGEQLAALVRLRRPVQPVGCDVGFALLGTTDTAAGTPRGPNTGKIRPEDVAAYFQTPEFQGLSSKDKRARIAELKGKVAEQG